jgi:hypothetical protein
MSESPGGDAECMDRLTWQLIESGLWRRGPVTLVVATRHGLNQHTNADVNVTERQGKMNPQLSAVVIGVDDFDRAETFCSSSGLGCPIEREHGQFVRFKLGDGSDVALNRRDPLAEMPASRPTGRASAAPPSAALSRRRSASTR